MALTKMQSAILAAILELGRQVHKTKLVKLIYLIDNAFYQNVGRTLTGLEYMWDDYGPNAMSNAIIKEADALANRGLLLARDKVSVYGTASRTYEPGLRRIQLDQLQLDLIEWDFIREGVAQYGRMSIQKIVKVSKETEAFRNISQYQRLEMKESAQVKAFKEKLLSDKEYVASLDKAYAAIQRGGGKTLDEIERERRTR